MIKIYKIIYNGDIIYIGKTKLTLKKRKACVNSSVPIDIYKLSTIELIEETDDVSRERYWIEYYKEIGVKLMNKRNGDHSSETYNESYLNRLLKWKTKRGFSKNTYEENRETQRKYKLDNKESLKEKRREYRKKNRLDNKLNKLFVYTHIKYENEK